MPFRREKIHDSFDGLVGVVRVESPQAEVPGLGVINGCFHRFYIADFPDEDHIRSLPQGMFEGAGISMGVYANFPLGDDGHFMGMDEFDRVLDRDDVTRGVRVSVIDDCRQSGRFSRPGLARQRSPAPVWSWPSF